MNFNFIKKLKGPNFKGFMVMEVIVAIFLIVTGVIGTYALTTYSISSSTFVSDKFIASYLAQEGIELVRNIRDTNWLEVPTAWDWDGGIRDSAENSFCSGSCEEPIWGGCELDYSSSQFFDFTLNGETYSGQPLKYDPDVLYNYVWGDATKFKRQIVINSSSSDQFDICVRVEWEERGISHNVLVRENLYNWR